MCRKKRQRISSTSDEELPFTSTKMKTELFRAPIQIEEAIAISSDEEDSKKKIKKLFKPSVIVNEICTISSEED